MNNHMTALPFDSSLSSVHRNPLLRSTLNELPEWSGLLEHLHLVDDAIKQAPRRGTVADNVEVELIDELAAGRGIPKDLERRAAKIHALITGHDAALAGLNRARTHLINQLDQTVRDNFDTMFTALNTRLGAVVAAVQGLGNLDGLSSADVAIAGNRAEEYRKLRSAGESYEEVRRAQLALMRASGDLESQGADIHYAEARLMPHTLDVFPEWPTWILEGRHPLKNPPPWPHGHTPTERNTLGTGQEFMVWAVNHGAELWVPTRNQYADATRELEQARIEAVYPADEGTVPA